MFLIKMFKFDLNLKNAATIWEKVFCFFHNCIWIDYVKLTLLRREYLQLVVNVLTESTKILYITQRDFFQFNFFHSDQ